MSVVSSTGSGDKNSKTRDISKSYPAKLGLPKAESVENVTNTETANDYALVCEYIQKTFDGKKIYSFLQSRIASCLIRLRKAIGASAPVHGIETKFEADAWKLCLQNWSTTVKATDQQAHTKAANIASAPAVLKFWVELTRLQDLTAFANADENAMTILQFSDLSHHLPNVQMFEEALLLICRKKFDRDPKKQWVPIVGAWLKLLDNDKLGPNFAAPLVINQTEFFDAETNEPLAGLDTTAIEQWVCLAPPSDSSKSFEASESQRPGDDEKKPFAVDENEAWPDFYARWQALTKLWLDCPDGLAGLSVKLLGAQTPQFTIKLVNVKEVQTNQHAAQLEAATQKLDDLPLLSNVLSRLAEPVRRTATNLASMNCSRFLGHMDTCKDGARSAAFPLDSTQRLAAMAVSSLPFSDKSELLPINGPPGTGKTSFLRAALASIWVQAALDKAPHPKIVYGTAATNQAVSNMIEAFGTIRSTQPDGAAYSWLDNLPSYGWFFPSQAAAEKRPDLMHLAWSSEAKTVFMPKGAAQEFAQTRVDDHKAMLITRAKTALSMSNADATLEQVTQATYARLESERKRLHIQQGAYRQALALAAQKWNEARGQALRLRLFCTNLEAFQNELAALSAQETLHNGALEVVDLLVEQELKLEASWRALLPEFIRQWIWRRDLMDLVSLRLRASSNLKKIGMKLPSEIPSIKSCQRQLNSDIATLGNYSESKSKQVQSALDKVDSATRAIQDRRSTVHALFILAGLVDSTKSEKLESQADIDSRNTKKFCLALQLSRWVRSGRDQSAKEYSQLIHYFEAALDTQRRVQLFHWAARYWECRWVEAQTRSAPKNDAERLERMMMLGVIIVATTHKVLKLGNTRAADLLIMDEAGQCLPEIAASCLTLSRNAAFVGDVLQLQPVANISASMQDSIAQKYGQRELLPDVVKPLQGSAMKLAQAVALSSTGVDPGITLLFHYRCVPQIIGYCNELLYNGRIQNARTEARLAHLGWMPSMSWVGVVGVPTRSGGSWTNPDEVNAIVKWLVGQIDLLTLTATKTGEQKRLALRDVVAIVTPLAAQATLLRQALTDAIGEKEVEGMVIGTVHKLQGAERPVVLFSLVQSLGTNARLMADRDGGMLMNVAVSRARDAFVIFADRSTLKPALIDAQNERASDKLRRPPISFLGLYLRQHGQRLYPNVLVIVEAPGKVKRIEEALGAEVAVIATSGTLRKPSLSIAGLSWAQSPEKWRKSLSEHAGLVREIVIATDDDLAGELIGMHAAEDATLAFEQYLYKGRSVTIRRMRFSDMTPASLMTAYKSAGAKFDANRLAAALVREFANGIDSVIYKESKLPMSTYASAQVRDCLAWLEEETRRTGADETSGLREIWCTLRTPDGCELQGFVAADQGALAKPLVLDKVDARQLAEDLLDSTELGSPQFRTAVQIPGLYPANTTPRVLAMAVDELGLDIDVVQNHLNALYLQGAEPSAVTDGESS